jgi:hypothetical protein
MLRTSRTIKPILFFNMHHTTDQRTSISTPAFEYVVNMMRQHNAPYIEKVSFNSLPGLKYSQKRRMAVMV